MLLQTLIKIGKALSTENRNEWEDFLNKKVDIGKPIKTKEGEIMPKNYVATLFFDLDNQEIKTELVAEYDAMANLKYYNVDILKGNNKAIYTCVVKGKCELLRKTFWGGKDAAQGQFIEAIEKDFPLLMHTAFVEVLYEIFRLKAKFEDSFLIPDSKKEGDFLVDEKKLFEGIGLNATDRIALVVTSFVWKEKGFDTPTFFKEVEGYERFLKAKFLKMNISEDESTEKLHEQNKQIAMGFEDTTEVSLKGSEDVKLCYASGEQSATTSTLSINARYSLNKMFVETTQNYAAGFEEKWFHKSYQIDTEVQKYLERGSSYLLNSANVNIANVPHCIIPRFLSFDESADDVIMELGKMTHKAELLFKYQEYIKKIEKNIEDKDSELPYWITFLGFESDGNSLKTVNLIEDVSNTHFQKVQIALLDISDAMAEIEGINWQSIMSRGKDTGGILSFNFYSIYMLIPIGKNGKTNPALLLFKALLEQHNIEKAQIFSHFKELILCHRFGRHKAYAQKIREYTDFDYAIRDVVFQYHALLKLVQHFNLFNNMKDNNQNELQQDTIEPIEGKNSIEDFFVKMAYNDDQKAMFYLGQILNSVAFAQSKKNHNKPILNKLNYNGMDVESVMWLNNELKEKTKQYDILGFTEGVFSKFTIHFSANHFQLKPAETLFYILSGYSFRA